MMPRSYLIRAIPPTAHAHHVNVMVVRPDRHSQSAADNRQNTIRQRDRLVMVPLNELDSDEIIIIGWIDELGVLSQCVERSERVLRCPGAEY
jgi:hypothetical protein